MTLSVINTLLSHHPLDAAEIAAAIERGEIAVAMGLEAEPKTLVNFFREASSKGGQARIAAQYQGQMRVARHLLGLGADPWLTDYYGNDAFDYAVQLGNAELTRTLATRRDAPPDLLTRQRRQGYAPTIFQATNNAPLLRTLIELGFDPYTTKNSATLLHEADNAEVVQLLLSAGLDPNTKNDNGLDVQAYWDQRSMPAPVRAKMETVLQEAAPQDTQRLLQEFAKSCVDVGVPAAKRRLVAAGIDPSSARYGGFSLPELVALHGISRGLAATSYHNQGNPNSHRKWRKLLMSVAQHCQVDKWSTPEKARLHDVVELFEVVDYYLIDANRPKTPSYSSSTGKKKVAPPPDTSREQLRETMGLPARAGSPSIEADQVGRWTSIMEDAVAIKALDNGSLAMWWVAAHHRGRWNNTGNWAQPVRGEPVLVRMFKQITRGEFDQDWKGPKSVATRSMTPAISLLPLPSPMPEWFLRYPGALGSVALMLAHTKGKSPLLGWMQQQIQSFQAFEGGDRWLEAGAQAMQASNDDVVSEVGRELATLYTQQKLQDATPGTGSPRRGPRL